MEYKTISAKLPIDELTQFKDFCKRKGTTPSYLIREMILKEMEFPFPNSVAGKNIIEYVKETDTFTWSILLDDNQRHMILENISPNFINDLKNVLDRRLLDRNAFIKKKKKDSVPVPSNLLKKKR